MPPPVLIIGVLFVAAATFLGSRLARNHRAMGAIIAAFLAVVALIGGQFVTEGWKIWRGEPVQAQHNKNIDEKLDRLLALMGGIETDKRKMLEKEYPGGHKIFAVTKNNKIVQSPKVSDQIQTDWSRISAEDKGNVIAIKIPYLKFMNSTFVNASFGIPKKIGASLIIIGSPHVDLYAKVLDINENNVIVVLGIKKK
jgi:hypothetical protein